MEHLSLSFPVGADELRGECAFASDRVQIQTNPFTCHARAPGVVCETLFDSVNESPRGLGGSLLPPRKEPRAKDLWAQRARDVLKNYPQLRCLNWRPDAQGDDAWWISCNWLFECARRGCDRRPRDVGYAFAVPYVCALDNQGGGVLEKYDDGKTTTSRVQTPYYACVVCVGTRNLSCVHVCKCGTIESKSFYALARHVEKEHPEHFVYYTSKFDSSWRVAKDLSVPHAKSASNDRRRAVLDEVAELPPVDRERVQRAHYFIVSWVLAQGLPRQRCYDAIWTGLSAILCGERLPPITPGIAYSIVQECESSIEEYTRQVLQSAEYISLVYDLWASRGKEQVFGLLACALDKYGNVRRMVVDVSTCFQLTADEMVQCAERAKKRYPVLEKKLCGIVCDAASNTLRARDILASPQASMFQLTCVSHSACTILKHTWLEVSQLLLFPEVGKRFSQDFDPRRNTRTPHGTHVSRSAALTAEQWGGDHKAGCYTLEELFKLIPQVQNHIRKSSLAQSAMKDVVWLTRIEDNPDETFQSFKVPVDELGSFNTVIAPTRFAYRYIFLCEVCKIQGHLLAAFEHAVASSSQRKWPDRARVTKDAFAVYRALAALMKPLAELALDAQHADGAFTASDVAKRVWMTYANSKVELQKAEARVVSLQDESVHATLVDTTIARLQVAYHSAQLDELEKRDSGFAQFLHWVTQASTTTGGALKSIACTNDTSLFIGALFLDPNIWTDADLEKSVSDPLGSPAVGRPSVLHEVLIKMSAVIVRLYEEMFPQRSYERPVEAHTDALLAEVLEQSTFAVNLTKQQLLEEIRRYIQFAQNTDVEKGTFRTVYTKYARVHNAETAQISLAQFWCTSQKAQEFTLLGKLARKIFSVPVTQIDCERLFSFFGDLTRGKRNRTSIDWLYKSAITRFNCPWEELMRRAFPNVRPSRIDSGPTGIDANRIERTQSARDSSSEPCRDLSTAFNAANRQLTQLVECERIDMTPDGTGLHALVTENDDPNRGTVDMVETRGVTNAALTNQSPELTNEAPLEEVTSPRANTTRRKSALGIQGSARKEEQQPRRSKRATTDQRANLRTREQ